MNECLVCTSSNHPESVVLKVGFEVWEQVSWGKHLVVPQLSQPGAVVVWIELPFGCWVKGLVVVTLHLYHKHVICKHPGKHPGKHTAMFTSLCVLTSKDSA